jgi:glycosyltransferase involved in cell wall biosynthesis
MRLLVLLTDLFDKVGGIQTLNRSLVKALSEIAKENNHTVTLLVLNDHGKNKDTSRYIDSNYVKYLPFNGSRFKFIASVIYYAFNASVIFIGHINFSPIITCLKLINLKTKILQMVYGVEVSKKLPFLYVIGMNQIDKIISISLDTKDKMLSSHKINKNKFEILPCTLDPFYGEDVILKTNEELLFPKGKMILTVSRLEASEKYKNIELVIKTMPNILEEVPDAFYVIVGEGTDRNRLEVIANNKGLSEKVIFKGNIPASDLGSYYNSCDVFVLPSTGEGFGIVFLEAMYYSKPCIGAKAGGVPEVIEDGKTGILCDDNVKSLSESVIRLLKDKSLSALMGKAGHERFNDKFSFQIYKKKLKEIMIG